MIMARFASRIDVGTALAPVRSIAMTDITFIAWLAQAQPGDVQIYYRGFLAVDAEMELGGLSAMQRRELRALADAAFRAAQQGLVHLAQVRLATDRFAYLAIARPKPSEPKSTALARLLAAA